MKCSVNIRANLNYRVLNSPTLTASKFFFEFVKLS